MAIFSASRRNVESCMLPIGLRVVCEQIAKLIVCNIPPPTPVTGLHVWCTFNETHKKL